MEQLPTLIEQSMSEVAYSCLLDMLCIGCLGMFIAVLVIAIRN